MKFSVGNLGGTLYKGSVPICEFKFERGQLRYVEVLTSDKALIPVDCLHKGFTGDSLINFFFFRTTPATRRGIDAYLAMTPVQFYYPERIIRYSEGKCIDDDYWLKCDDDKICWD